MKTGVSMVTGGFGPYQGLWLDDAPTKRIGVIHAHTKDYDGCAWFGQNFQAHK
jgi:hypothetical protein